MRSQAPDTPWSTVAALIDRAATLDDLRAHRLQLLAASLWLAEGRRVPEELRADRRHAATMALAAPTLLERARRAYDGPLLVMKGPEVAAGYPEASARHYRDLDLLAEDPMGAQRALLAAGFQQVGGDTSHHLPSLCWPGLPLCIEIHRHPKLPSWLPAPSPAELLAGAIPSRTGIDGLLAPRPEVHALLLAAHAWAHRPLGRIGDLVDIVAVLPAEQWSDASALARKWDWNGLWEITAGTASALFFGEERAPLVARLCARNLRAVRDPSVLRYHALRVLAPLAASTPHRSPAVLADSALQLSRTRTDERWNETLSRSIITLRHAFSSKSVFDRSANQHPWQR